MVVSWDTVGYYDMKTDKTNMFQLIIASNEEETYTVFLFPESGVQWVRGSGKNSNQPDPQARGQHSAENLVEQSVDVLS